MKNALICSALCAALASGVAHADNHGTSGSNGLTTNDLVANGYAEARLGFADMGLSDDAIVIAGTFGTSLDQILPGLGAEAELTLTAADAEQSYSDGFGNNYKLEASYFGLGGYATYTLNLDEQVKGLELLGRAGLVYVDAEVDTEFGSGSDSSIELGVGIGARYNLQNNLAIVGRFDTYDIDVLSIGATYRF
ncbi:outer membrane beta-barrel protein [Marinobacter pelagius]|uniref:Opacity protein n=1 Tax=Marinobacter pelagius TaxID=379482 RepID=A0A1I4TJU6_9GAMM|nr:outer membrane beta-barrel protein [Marinobacter pelagius]SFM76979.1 Opacity protein [Marinobacter pelagius]